MAEKEALTNKRFSPDWFVRGALAKLGDTFDRFAGRNWQPSSSLATSQLIERLRNLLDSEKKEVSGKGYVVPHNIKLKMQWDKFSDDEGNASLEKLENELLIAAADHINDNLYYTYAPLHLEVKADYFTEGVKLLVSFDRFADENPEAELNVTMPLIAPSELSPSVEGPATSKRRLKAAFVLNGKGIERMLDVPVDGRLTVGRTGGNGLLIDDNSVSKVHASISVDVEGRLSVADTGSTNGTFINGERIAYGKAVPFSESDTVGFGSVEVRFTLILPEPVEEITDAESPEDGSVQIGGFEFRSRAEEPPSELPAAKTKTDPGSPDAADAAAEPEREDRPE